MKRRPLSFSAAVAAILAVGSAGASPIVMTFEGLHDLEPVLDHYAGGAGGMGSIGPDYGVYFSPNALAVRSIEAGGSGNFTNAPSGDTTLAYVDGDGVLMNVPGGFTGGFSFYYSAYEPGSVALYDGPDGTGTPLAWLDLPANAHDGCDPVANAFYCNYDILGVAFKGTVFSVGLSGALNHIGFDSITLFSDFPDAVRIPLPGSAPLFGLGLLLLAAGAARGRH